VLTLSLIPLDSFVPADTSVTRSGMFFASLPLESTRTSAGWCWRPHVGFRDKTEATRVDSPLDAATGNDLWQRRSGFASALETGWIIYETARTELCVFRRFS